MAGFVITTDLAPRKLLKAAKEAAEDLGFSAYDVDEWSFQAIKGNFLLSVFLGAFIAYCDFKVEVLEGKYAEECDIVITRNTPWWTGAIGISRVQSRAKELADRLGDYIEDRGARVIKEKQL